MTGDASWTIRPYRSGDEAALAELFGRVFARPMSEAHWRWKLSGRAFPAPNVFLAVARDQPICQCAAIPVRYAGPDGEVTGLVAVDAMTDPRFRRQGVLTEVCRHAYDQWRRAGAAFVVGLPNQQWGTRTQALGWRDLFPLAWCVRPIDVEAIVSRRLGSLAGAAGRPIGRLWGRYWRRRAPHDPALQVRRVWSAEAFDRLWPALEHQRPMQSGYTIIRDRAWIEWRYLRAPDVSYAVWLAERAGMPAGYAVTRMREESGRRLGYLAELAAIGDHPVVSSALIDAAVAHLGAEGVELVASLIVPGSPPEVAFRRAGFLFSWGRFRVHAVPLQSDAVPSLSSVFGGDFDVV